VQEFTSKEYFVTYKNRYGDIISRYMWAKNHTEAKAVWEASAYAVNAEFLSIDIVLKP
jgi:hypothetical protein